MWDKKNLAKSYDVFISYRRDKRGVVAAHLVKARLEKSGYRVFLDVEELRQGDFNKALLARIESIEHFVVILTPNSLERCYQKGDWLYREIKCAFKHNRNIVPIMFDDTEAAPPPPPRETDSLEARKRNRCVYRKLQKLYNFQACVCRSESLTRDLRRLSDYLPLGYLRAATRVCCSRWFSGVLAGICVLAALVPSVCYQRQREQLLTENLDISVKYEMGAVAYLIQEAAKFSCESYDNEAVVAYDDKRIRQEYQKLKNYYEHQKENKVLSETTKKTESARIDKTVDEYITKRNKIHQALDEYFNNFENEKSLFFISKVLKEYNDLRQWYDCNDLRGTVRSRLISLDNIMIGVGQQNMARLQKEYAREKKENADAYRQRFILSKKSPQEVELYFSH